MTDDRTIDVGPVHVLTDEQVRWHADSEYRRRNARLSLTAEQYQREQDSIAREVQESRAEIERLRAENGALSAGVARNGTRWEAERALADRLARTGSDLPPTDSTLSDINLHYAGKCGHRCTTCAKKAWSDALAAYEEARRED